MRNKATYTAKTVGCLCLSLFKGQPQTTDQLPSRVRMLQLLLFLLIVHIAHFFQSILKNFFLVSNTHIQSEG